MNQPTIPLSQLQCYLAFGLNIKNMKTGNTFSLTGADSPTPDELILFSSVVVYNTTKLDFKPLVIPLTSLTDEDWVEVFKAGGFNEKLFKIEIDESWVYAVINNSRSMCYSKIFNCFLCKSIFNQLLAFQKLFELHADVWGWVEAGLALNKLEVGK